MTALLVLAAAAAFTDPATLDADVARFTGAPLGAEGGAMLPVDRRLRLRPCAVPPALSWHTQRRDSVLVECPEPGGWRLFVAVKRMADPLAAAPAVQRGEVVTIIVSGDGFTVSQSGEAMEAGAPGAWIRVRTANPKAPPLRARVVRPGLVEAVAP